jgi:hypothetical protein
MTKACQTDYAGQYGALADCLSVVETKYQPIHSQPADLLELFQAKRKVISDKVDKGLLTPDEGKLAEAQARTEVVEMQVRREAAQNPAPTYVSGPAVSGPTGASGPTSLDYFELARRALQPPLEPPAAVNTTCTSTGPFLNCTTH